MQYKNTAKFKAYFIDFQFYFARLQPAALRKIVILKIFLRGSGTRS